MRVLIHSNREELDRNLDIINDYEKRDDNGNITVPITQLMKHDDYVKAKEWLAHNARYVATESVMELVNQAFKVFREGKQGRKLLSIIAKKQDAYDERGVIDGRKLTEQNIKQFDALQKSIEMLIESDKDDIKSWLVEKHHYFCYEKGYIDDYSLDCMERRYRHYADEGGNSYAATLMAEVRALPKMSMMKDGHNN